jgi:hypothetical protein
MSTVTATWAIATGVPVPTGLQADWLAGMTLAAASKINTRWNAVVGSNDKWTANVAVRSGRVYKKFPSSTFVSRRGLTRAEIVGKQQRKLTLAYQKAQDAHDTEFAGGGTKFIEHVTDKQAHYGTGAGNTFALTGARITQFRGPISQAVRLATGDLTYQRDNPPAVAGEPDPEGLDTPEVAYILPHLKGMFRAAFAGKLIQLGVMLLQGDIPDVTIANDILDEGLKGFVVDRTTVPGANSIHYANDGGLTLVLALDNAGLTAYP